MSDGQDTKGSGMSGMAELTATLQSIDNALAELLDGERREDDGLLAALKEIEKSIRSLKIEAPAVKSPDVTVNVPQQPAPTVNVQVRPTPINVTAQMPEQPAPIVNVTPPAAPRAKSFTLEFKDRYGGVERTMTITPNYGSA